MSRLDRSIRRAQWRATAKLVPARSIMVGVVPVRIEAHREPSYHDWLVAQKLRHEGFQKALRTARTDLGLAATSTDMRSRARAAT